MEVKEIVEEIVNEVIDKLTSEELLECDKSDSFKKTETLLRNYRKLQRAEQTKSVRKVISRVNDALKFIENDPYAKVIWLYCIDGCSRDGVAYTLGVSPSVVSRQKTRLINEIKVILFADDFVKEIYDAKPPIESD